MKKPVKQKVPEPAQCAPVAPKVVVDIYHNAIEDCRKLERALHQESYNQANSDLFPVSRFITSCDDAVVREELLDKVEALRECMVAVLFQRRMREAQIRDMSTRLDRSPCR